MFYLNKVNIQKTDIEKLLTFLVFLIPFILWGGIYTSIKTYAFLLVVVISLITWPILLRGKHPKLSSVDGIYFIWILILFFASLIGIHPLDSMIGGSIRGQGIIFFMGLWIFGFTVRLFSNGSKTLLLKSLALSNFIESIIVILQYKSGWLVGGRAIGTIGEPNSLAAFLILSSLGGLLIKNLKIRILFYLITLVAIVMTGSVTGLASFLTLASVYLILKLNGGAKFLAFSFLFLAISLVLVGTFEYKNKTIDDRSLIWLVAIKAMSERPLIGYGAESGEAVFNTSFIKWQSALDGLTIDRAHNLILDLLMWAGIPGFVVFTIWIYKSLKKINGSLRQEKLAYFSAWIFFSMFQPLGVLQWLLMFIIFEV